MSDMERDQLENEELVDEEATKEAVEDEAVEKLGDDEEINVDDIEGLDDFEIFADIEKNKEDEDGADIVYINALMDARHYKCASPIRLFWERLKAAWLVLTGKDRPLHDICLRRDDWLEFYNKITEFTNKMRKD